MGFSRYSRDKENLLVFHASENDYHSHIETYLQTEMEHKSVIGPYDKPPHATHVSPFMSREKLDCDNRRIIIDLSWPEQASINHLTLPKYYLGTAYKLQYPTIDNITNYLRELGEEECLYKIDLSPAFQQLRIDPGDFNLLCLKWKESYFPGNCCLFGHRSGTMACTCLFQFIMWKNQYTIYLTMWMIF